MKLAILNHPFIVKIATLCALLLSSGAAVLYFWLLADLPPISSVETRLVRPTTQILDRNGKLLYEVVDPNAGKQISLALETLPAACIQATLSTEDSRFYYHPGVDPIAIGRAVWQNLNGRAVVSGGSTLTQQLARNLLMPPPERYEQSLARKLREAYLASRLEFRYTKDELLALYLNQTYYGNWAFGLEAAAQVFFAKPAAQLSRGECSLLAGLIQYPTGYNPLLEPETAKARQLTVLRLMQEAGYLSADEAAQVAAEPLRYRSNLFDIEAPHFVMYVQDLLVQQLGVEAVRNGGLRVTTSLDLDLQRQAEAAVRRRLDQLNCRTPGVCDAYTDPNRRVDNAAAVVLDSHSGDILSMVGSPDYFDARIQGNVNAALTLRQPGSAIKPLTYAAALDPDWSARRGQPPLTPGTILADLPTTFYVKDVDPLGRQIGNAPYAPVNYDRAYHGPVSVRAALANSYNIPAVKVLDQIGVDALQQIAGQAGISTFTKEYGLALTLGGGEVRLLELSATFGIFEQGDRLEPRAILRIEQNGAPIAAAPLAAPGPQVITPQTAYLITDILSDPVARMPAFGQGSILELPFAAAAKTGTTTDWRDNWTVGYSTQRIVGVWVGNADNTPMLDVSGIDGAGPIWRDLMLAAHAQTPPPFQRPDHIVELSICGPSGLLPTPACQQSRRERFIAGTEPTQPDNQFQTIAIDLATGRRADAATPANRRGQRTYWRLPPEYREWMLAQGIALAPPAPTPAQPANIANSTNAIAPAVGQPLLLTAPTSNTAYQIHPGLPADRQRIELSGYAAGGEPWAELRLMKDGEQLWQGTNVSHIEGSWALTEGAHHFWLEGRRAADDEIVRSPPALVQVEPFNAVSAQVAVGQ
ncbi:MAG: transglycosylase domain-containing protein [Caldilineaceae bacterium]